MTETETSTEAAPRLTSAVVREQLSEVRERLAIVEAEREVLVKLQDAYEATLEYQGESERGLSLSYGICGRLWVSTDSSVRCPACP